MTSSDSFWCAKEMMKREKTRKEKVSKNRVSSINELIPLYLENVHLYLVTLRRALDEENFDEIENIGHKMKGSGKSFGFERISELGKEIEERSREKNKNTLRKLAKSMEDYLSDVYPPLKSSDENRKTI